VSGGKKRSRPPTSKRSSQSTPAAPPASAASEGEVLEPMTDDEVDMRSTFEPRDDVAEISGYVPDASRFEEEQAAVPPPARPRVGNVEDELRDVEAEVDRIWAGRPRRNDDDLDEPPKSVLERLREAIPVELPGGEDGTLADAAKDVLSTDYYLRQWGRLGLRNRSEEVDEYGLDPVYEKKLRPLFDNLFKLYFRTEVRGIENVPAEGRVLLVANHSGVLPYDGIMVRTAMRLEQAQQREVRWLAEDFVYHLPFVGALMNRIGAVRACQENAERLLKQERCVLVFPEGIKGIGKLYRDRYRLQRFGRGGFIKLAIRAKAPIVPVSIIGAEEA